jgi:hypothetical protein
MATPKKNKENPAVRAAAAETVKVEKTSVTPAVTETVSVPPTSDELKPGAVVPVTVTTRKGWRLEVTGSKGVIFNPKGQKVSCELPLPQAERAFDRFSA